MNVLALDLSLTGTGVCHNGSTSTIKTKLKDEDRFDYILSEIEKFTNPIPDYAILEGLAFAATTGKPNDRAGLWWLVKMKLWYKGVPVAVCPPTTLKKYVTGSGRADKDAMLLSIVKTFPLEPANNNEADSIGLYAMAKDHLGEALVVLPKVQRESLDKVQWPNL